MPKIVWPQQPRHIADACRTHGLTCSVALQALLELPAPPVMSAPVATTFLRCFYASRDLARTERDLAGGGGATAELAATAVSRRVSELERRLRALERLL